MASIIKRPNGTREVRFTVDGERKTVRLGSCTARDADRVLYHVERVVQARNLNQSLPQDTADYLAEMNDELYTRFVRVGLLASRQTAGDTLTLEALFDQYTARRTDLKPGTLLIFGQARLHLLKHFGDRRVAATITVGEGKDFRRYLIGKYSEAYTAKMVRTVKQVWIDALDRELFKANPWQKVRAGSKRNTERQYYVTRDVIERIIAAAPDAQWRLLIALSRYAGLRCPSEHLRLTWGDIDWANNRMTIHASKTEHHADKGIRVIPLFPVLRPHLQSVFDQAAEGELHVITRYRASNANLRSQFTKIITRAGLSPWPRLFQNLRASRQTELAEKLPLQTVCKWIGNSEQVAKLHYLQVHDEHYDVAMTIDEGAPKSAPLNAASAGTGGTSDLQGGSIMPENEKTPETGGVHVGPHGFEVAPEDLRFLKISRRGAPKSAPITDENVTARTNAALQRIHRTLQAALRDEERRLARGEARRA